MTATSPTPPAQIDSSCRLPLISLFGGAAVWLALSSVLGLLASLKFHAPAMFANCACLSYGRLFPASQFLLVYGFCIPAGLGVGLWLLARLGRVELAQPFLVTIGATLWQIGVLVGLIAILAGENTGFEWLEMPRYASVILFFSFLLITLWAFVTHSRRSAGELYPSQWFTLASLFWFPWILTTATLLLQWFPVRGMAQASIAWWFAGNLLNVWLTLAGLAATYYFLPKLAARPLQSRYLALFVILTTMVFGTWTGIPASAALPAWMPSLSAGTKLLLLVPALAVAASVVLTCRGSTTPCNGGSYCFTKFGAWSLVAASVLVALTASPQISRITDFTWFSHGQNAIRIYGFFAMTMFAAIYFILPLLVGEGRICPIGTRLHFWLTMGGTLLLGFPLVIAGVIQGLKLVNPEIAFLDAMKSSLMPFRLSTLGETMIVLGNVVFLFNISRGILRYYCSLCKTACADMTTVLQPAGVKS